MLDDQPTENPSCIFCDGRDLFDLPATIAEQRWPVCKLCAGAGATLLREGVLEECPDCLHMVAMELERFSDGYAIKSDQVSMRWRFRLRRNLARSVFRPLCGCDICDKVRHGEVFVIVTNMFENDPFQSDPFETVYAETFADTMPLQVLRSMPPGQKIPASDGTIWTASAEISRRMMSNAAETAIPPTGDLARSATPKKRGAWVEVFDQETGDSWQEYRAIDPVARAERDAETKHYWAGYRKWGTGYIEDDYFVDGDGELHYHPRPSRMGPVQ